MRPSSVSAYFWLLCVALQIMRLLRLLLCADFRYDAVLSDLVPTPYTRVSILGEIGSNRSVVQQTYSTLVKICFINSI